MIDRTAERRHGQPWDVAPEEILAVFLSNDPDLVFVGANMGVWMDARACRCHAMCICDGDARCER